MYHNFPKRVYYYDDNNKLQGGKVRCCKVHATPLCVIYIVLSCLLLPSELYILDCTFQIQQSCMYAGPTRDPEGPDVCIIQYNVQY